LLDIYGSLGISGKEAEQILEHIGVSTNKNMIPYDTRKPLDPSGIRIGTPAITTR
jgi:glycine hydroxymethyltransferase